jgi:hypothetical protein
MFTQIAPTLATELHTDRLRVAASFRNNSASSSWAPSSKPKSSHAVHAPRAMRKAAGAGSARYRKS